MAQQTRTQLKTYFETGDTPTEAEFINLIDSLLNLTDDDLDDIAEGATNKHFSDTEKTKLSGIDDGAEVNVVDSVNTKTGVVVIDPDDLDDSATTNKFTTAGDVSKLAGIEGGADVTDDVNVGSSIHGADAKASLVDGDKIAIIDSGASNVLKTSLWSVIKSTLKTYFDTLYASVLGSDDNYVTDAEKVVIGNTSGTNTGDDPGLENVSEDTTPQLGGELDAQAHSIGFTLQATTGDGTTTIDWKLGNKFKFTFGAQNETFTFTAPSKPCAVQLIIVQDGTGSRTITWPATVKWPGGTAPTLSTGAGAIDIISLLYDGTNYYGVSSLDFS